MGARSGVKAKSGAGRPRGRAMDNSFGGKKRVGKGVLDLLKNVAKSTKILSTLAGAIPKVGSVAGPIVKSLGYGKKKAAPKKKSKKGGNFLTDILGGLASGVGSLIGLGKKGGSAVVPIGQFSASSMPASYPRAQYKQGLGRR